MLFSVKIKFVFFGSPQLSADILDDLKRHDLVPSLIVTKPDRPQGRKMALTPPPVKRWAQKNKIKFLQPEKLDFVFNQQLTTYNLQLFIVVAYGAILPRHILDIPKHGALNIHYSLLPKYRGASPVESQILADDRNTGISLMLIDEKLDHGPLLAQKPVTVPNWPPSAPELRALYTLAAGPLLAQTMQDWSAGKIQSVPQDESKATYTRKFTKTDGEIDLSADPYQNFLKIRAFEGSVGTYFYADARRLKKQTQMHADIKKNQRQSASPSASIRVLIKAAEFRGGTLHILRVIPEGRKEIRYEEFVRGIH